jgi:hypothetical protein
MTSTPLDPATRHTRKKCEPVPVPIPHLVSAYEEGRLDHEQAVALFQRLIDTHLVWQLQGSYGRQAMEFIRSGECTNSSVMAAIMSKEV